MQAGKLRHPDGPFASPVILNEDALGLFEQASSCRPLWLTLELPCSVWPPQHYLESGLAFRDHALASSQGSCAGLQ